MAHTKEKLAMIENEDETGGNDSDEYDFSETTKGS